MYEVSVQTLRQKIHEKFPDLASDDNGNKAPASRSSHRKLASYLLWMCEKIPTLNDPRKATAWIAWAMARAEVPLGLFGNDVTRDCFRTDIPDYEQKAVEYYTNLDLRPG